MEDPPPNARTVPSTEHLLWLAIVIFAVNYPLLKFALGAMSPSLLNAVRLTFSAAVLAGVYLYCGRELKSDWAYLTTGGAARVLPLGAIAYGLSPVLFLLGMHLTSAANAALMVASAPIWTALVGRLTGLETMRPLGWAGLVLCLIGTAGVGLAGAPELDLTGRHVLGSAILLVDAALWGGFTALSRPLMDRISPLGLTVWGLIAGLPLLYLAAVPSVLGFAWGDLSLAVWLAIVGSGVFGMGLALTWWNGAVKQLGATVTGVYGNLIPLVAVILSVAFLGETIQYGQLLGGLFIVVGTALVRYQRNRGDLAPARLPG